MTLERMDSMVLKTCPRNWSGVWRSNARCRARCHRHADAREHHEHERAAYEPTWPNNMYAAPCSRYDSVTVCLSRRNSPTGGDARDRTADQQAEPGEARDGTDAAGAAVEDLVRRTARTEPVPRLDPSTSRTRPSPTPIIAGRGARTRGRVGFKPWPRGWSCCRAFDGEVAGTETCQMAHVENTKESESTTKASETQPGGWTCASSEQRRERGRLRGWVSESRRAVPGVAMVGRMAARPVKRRGEHQAGAQHVEQPGAATNRQDEGERDQARAKPPTIMVRLRSRWSSRRRHRGGDHRRYGRRQHDAAATSPSRLHHPSANTWTLSK